ncbi:MAG: peptide chain release factor N(5)-glutamine methyltransferase [Geitlerinemataceae cyanobacterium]
MTPDGPKSVDRRAIDAASLFSWYDEAIDRAAAASVARHELDWLLLQRCGLDRLTLRLRSPATRPIASQVSLDELATLWQQRLVDRVPVQYLAGSTTWRSLTLRVTPAVLIPRPETEAIVDLAIEAAGDRLEGHWADLGTGSGAIAIALAAELAALGKSATVHASDRSAAALAVARQNAIGCGDRVEFYQGSWFEPFAGSGLKFRAIVSNPPYIPAATVDELAPEVRDREPRLALDGGETGLDCLIELFDRAPDWLEADGILAVEHEARQGQVTRDLLIERGYRDVRTVRDFAGLDRFAIARCPSPRAYTKPRK